jgi:hypothetical protein
LTVALVQHAFNSSNAAVTSLTATFTNPVGNGNFVIGVITDGISTTFSGPSVIGDGHGNAATALLDNNQYAGGPLSTAAFYYQNVTNGAQAFTLTSGNQGFTAIGIQEWSGVATTSPIDVHNQTLSPGTSATISSPSVTTTVGGDGIYGYISGNTAAVGIGVLSSVGGSGATFTVENNDTTSNEQVFDSSAVQTSAGAVSASFTFTFSGQQSPIGIVAFKAAAAGTDGSTSQQIFKLKQRQIY